MAHAPTTTNARIASKNVDRAPMVTPAPTHRRPQPHVILQQHSKNHTIHTNESKLVQSLPAGHHSRRTGQRKRHYNTSQQTYWEMAIILNSQLAYNQTPTTPLLGSIQMVPPPNTLHPT